jgi:hypothetical protein
LIPPRNIVVLAAGLVMIALGFVYLARGSMTLAPVLLVAGYCVAIPVGIMLGAPVGRGDGKSVRREGE